MVPPGVRESHAAIADRFRPGWDARNPLTLSFLDPELERSYRSSVLEARRRRQRGAALGGAALFLALAITSPIVLELPVWPVSGLLGLLVVTNTANGILVGRARSIRTLDALGIGIQLSSGFLLLVLFVTVDILGRYGALALAAQSVFAFGVSRHPFRNAVVISAGHTLDFIAFGVFAGQAPGILVDALILGAAVGAASAGTYTAERGERRLYAQGLEVEHLHERVDGLLHSYLAPQVADTLISDPTRAELGGEEVEVTVLFADLTGFTSFAERVRPEEAVSMLNAAFGAAVPRVLAEGGTIVHFAGDALMAIFNAPTRQQDHALRAARAGLALQRATLATEAEPRMPRFRVALNTGPALVGNVGAAERRSFTAIGDTINLAARLQTFAPVGSVVLGERTRELLGASADVRPLGQPALKGKSVPVAVYELLRMTDAEQSS